MQSKNSLRARALLCRVKRRLNKNYIKKLRSKQAKPNKSCTVNCTFKEMSEKIHNKQLKNVTVK